MPTSVSDIELNEGQNIQTTLICLRKRQNPLNFLKLMLVERGHCSISLVITMKTDTKFSLFAAIRLEQHGLA